MTPDLSRLRWRKSSYSGGNGGQCVEIAWGESTVYMRDSKNPDGGALEIDEAAFARLLKAVEQGRFPV